VLAVEIFGNSRWRSGRLLKQLSRTPEICGSPQARQEFTAAEIASGSVSLDFTVTAEFAQEAGADAPFDIRLHRLDRAGLRIDAVDLISVGEAETAALPASNLRIPGRRRIVIIGNCQSETLRQGFAHIEALNRRFDAKYHFVDLQQNQREFV